jgi:2'-5' RNA ligase
MKTRCFVALPLPETYQMALSEITAVWKPSLHSRLTWTKAGNWHLTLRFLGELEPEMLAAVRDALHTVTGPAFPFQASGGGFFPPGKKPRVIWVGIARGAKRCIYLADQVDKSLQSLGFPLSSRPFRPHLTIARVKQPGSDDWSALLQWLHKREWSSFTVDKFVLYSSRLTPQGPIYTTIQEYSLDSGLQ